MTLQQKIRDEFDRIYPPLKWSKNVAANELIEIPIEVAHEASARENVYTFLDKIPALVIEEVEKVIPADNEMTLNEVNNGFALKARILQALSTLK